MDASWPLLPLQTKIIDHSIADKVIIFVFAVFASFFFLGQFNLQFLQVLVSLVV